MKNPLKVIQIVAKVAYIISWVAFIAAIIGSAGSLIGIIGLLISKPLLVKHNQLADLEAELGFSLGQAYLLLAVTALFCGGLIALAYLTKRYLKQELADGTPFTTSGAHTLFRLGIIHLAVSVGLAILCGIVIGIVYLATKISLPDNALLDFNGSGIGFSLMLLLLALIFQYGAQEKAEKSEKPEKNVDKN